MIAKKTTKLDLHDYDSQIKAADGTVPYNGYLWPTESWWPGHEPEFRTRIQGHWHFGIVALNDGRFAVDGIVSHIEANSTTPYRGENEPTGLKVVFATRTEAIRIAAARMIRNILRSQHRHRQRSLNWDLMDRETITDVINWTRAKVAEACHATPPKPIVLAQQKPEAHRPHSDFPLFEWIEIAGCWIDQEACGSLGGAAGMIPASGSRAHP